MLFDERDLNVFNSNESRIYFKEILQSYYSQNYRATIVMLYSFVIYDLFQKLQTMANEGDKKANQELADINAMITDDEKYSAVENKVINFYMKNSPLYFDRFSEDVDYLKNCRNKCAHLKVNDNSLYVPSDYHARMLICSMYDNVFSVNAPFIMDLFLMVQNDIENYSAAYLYVPNEKINEVKIEAVKNKFLKRMTYDSMKKSYRTFIKLLFVSDNENCEKNACGLYTFAYALTDHTIKEGFTQIFMEESIIDIFSKIDTEIIRNSPPRKNALISIVTRFPVVMDLIRSNTSLFDYISNIALSKPTEIKMYKIFYPRNEKSMYTFFIENTTLHNPCYTETLYESLNGCDDFNIEKFMNIMVNSIPSYDGFRDADVFMDSFKTHIREMSINSIEEIMKIYMKNRQCTNRARHSSDMDEIKKYKENYLNSHDNEEHTVTID